MTTSDVSVDRRHPLTDDLRNAHDGKRFFPILKRIFADIAPQLRADAEALKASPYHITPTTLAYLSLCYDLPYKTLVELVEEVRVLPCGTYGNKLGTFRVKDLHAAARQQDALLGPVLQAATLPTATTAAATGAQLVDTATGGHEDIH